MLDGGQQVLRYRRDTSAQRPQLSRSANSEPKNEHAAGTTVAAQPAPPSTNFAVGAAAPPACASGYKRKATLDVHLLRLAAEQEEALARCLSKKRLRPATGPTAADRLERLRARVLAKSAAAASHS